MKVPGYNDAETKEGGTPIETPPAGGYVFKIISVKEMDSKAGNPMIVFDLDISGGPFAGHYHMLKDKLDLKNWPLKFYQMMTPEKVPYYKGLIKAIRESNAKFPEQGFSTEDHEVELLAGLTVGGCLREEEYENREGEIKSGMKVMFLCSVDSAKELKAPKPKLLDRNKSYQSEQTTGTKDEGLNLPF